MPVHMIERVQRIPVPLEKVWDFFSNPSNLLVLTPADMDLQIISSETGSPIYSGQIIEYKLRPVWGLRVYWKTEIREVKEKEFFIDEQRSGPYKLWRHHHYFKEIPGGVGMTDVVHYQNPLGILGRAANSFFVRNRLKSIFDHRNRKVIELFGAWQNAD